MINLSRILELLLLLRNEFKKKIKRIDGFKPNYKMTACIKREAIGAEAEKVLVRSTSDKIFRQAFVLSLRLPD